MAKAVETQSTVGAELDALVAEHVLEHDIIRQKRGGIKERTFQGSIRPLRAYSRDMNAAWDVARKMRITLIPIQERNWFALVGKPEGWSSPAELMQYMLENNFTLGGAAIQESAPLAICLAALTAVQKKLSEQAQAALAKESHLTLAAAPEDRSLH